MNILKILTPKRITGNFGENAAARYLRKKGYKILERNFVAGGNEIDIIAKSRDTIAFIEVKTRTVGKESPLEPRPAAAVDYEKQRKIIASASLYLTNLQTRGKAEGLRARLDVMEVYVSDTKKKKTEKIIHIEGAFRKNHEIYQHTRYKQRRRK